VLKYLFIYIFIYIVQLLPIRQRRDNQTTGVADVLISVYRVGIRLSDVTVFPLSVPVELQLGEPFECTNMHTT
jgi:hypothetical protein